MKQQKTSKTGQRTRHQNLVRHKSGRYYARAFAGGKEVWKSLKTSHLSIAQAKLAEFLKEHRERVSNGNSEVSAKMTLAKPLRFICAILMTTRASNGAHASTGGNVLLRFEKAGRA
jgi:hypothetical protein